MRDVLIAKVREGQSSCCELAGPDSERVLNDTPSPRVNGESVGVRGNQNAGRHAENHESPSPLTLALSPKSGGEGIPAIGFEVPEPAGPKSQWVAVCRLDDIVPNTGVCALVRGRQIAVFRLDDDRVYAMDNHDPFSRANVLSRGIVGDLRGELVVASPVYKQHFSLVSGRCLEDAAVRVAVFPVRLEGGMVCVET